MSTIDTLNKHAVARQGDKVTVLFPPTKPLTPNEALVLAAYLVLMSEHDADNSFDVVLAAVAAGT